MSRRILTNMIFVGLLAAFASAGTWYVSPGGSADPNGSPDHPFATIQQAFDVAQNQDTVILLPGIYTGAGNYDLVLDGKSLTIRSEDPQRWTTVAATILDPQDAGGVFEFLNSPDVVTVEGLTFRNAQKFNPPYSLPHGAAIYGDTANVAIRRCVFQACTVGGFGGAVCFFSSQGMISHCQFAGNSGWNGGAIATILGSTVFVEHCTIAGNAASFYGGGVDCEFGSTLSITNSLLWGNRVLEYNSKGSQVYVADAGSVVSIDHSAVQNGLGGTDDNGSGTLIWGAGMTAADPQFVMYDSGISPFLWDFRLKSEFGRWDVSSQDWVTDAITSPCIDGGAEGSDYDAEPWPNGRRANMGAYGNTEEASLFGNIADLDISGRVDLLDLARLASVWQEVPIDYEDLDDSGVVGLSDLVILAENWLWD